MAALRRVTLWPGSNFAGRDVSPVKWEHSCDSHMVGFMGPVAENPAGKPDCVVDSCPHLGDSPRHLVDSGPDPVDSRGHSVHHSTPFRLSPALTPTRDLDRRGSGSDGPGR